MISAPRTDVLLSSSSVFPEPTAAAFEMAATVGYDGVEVMVWTDAVSQDGADAAIIRRFTEPRALTLWRAGRA